MPSFALSVTRFGLRAIGAVSPRHAGKLAFHIFSTTPSRKPKGAKAKGVHAAGMKRLAAAERLHVYLPAGGRVAAYRFAPAGGKPAQERYLVVHGWGSGSAYMADLAAGIAATGAEVIAIDFPGHGRSSGRVLNMRLAVEAIAAAELRFGSFDAAIGHSFGGASLMIAASGLLPGIRPLAAGKLALIGAPSEMGWLFEDYGRLLGLAPRVQAALEGQIHHVTGRRLGDFDAATLGQAFDRPLLVIHAEDDKEVSAEHARRYGNAGPHVRLHWANGHGHRRIVSAPDVIARLVEFLREPGRAQAAE
ncbi:alpha/beta hydrolase [Rhizobiaceae bacterium n13]|uniref:Alpha/beta hydrolase n=1 Tax=Ferirhizobium litorale TaxID=2927786 RepID=A0AAE3U5B4_9HYPH|nr:alpha/beta fold hydrolase [Fererhizobium litorale]MDI7863855.1 alpha/beta hydrolase [Fererhizobium litorale]MDI7924313.1 alpha/beta hydrolase [Fererhizobium litorale]